MTDTQLIKLVGVLTGTITGTIKFSDISYEEKKKLAESLIWCYESTGVQPLESVKNDIDNFLKK